MKGSLRLSLVLIGFMLIVHANPVFAQGTWSIAAAPDLTISISDLFFLPDGQTGWFVGDDGLILKTVDGGITREPQTSGTVEDLNRVAFINDSTGWIVGENGTILKTTDAGLTWNLQTVPDPTANFNEIAIASETAAFVVADAGKIVTTSDGVTWVERASGTTKNLLGVSCFGTDIAIAVGQTETIVRTTDGGVTWTPATTVAPIQAKNYYAIKMVSEKKAWLVGAGFPFLNLKSVFAWTDDGGDNWTLYLPNEEIYGNMWDIHFASETHGIAVGNGGVVMRTTNGTDWELAPIAFGFEPRSVSVVEDTIWVNRQEIIYKSEDFANSWTLLGNMNKEFLYDISAVDEGHAIAVGFNGAKLETSDGGYTWKSGYIVADNTINRLDGIYFLNSTTGWVVGVGGFVAKTEDAGATWRLVNNGIGDIWFRDVWFVNDSTGWVVGRFGTVLKTTDGGENWVAQTGFPTNKYVYAIQMFDENEGVIGGQDKNLFYTTDGGTTWIAATSPVAAADDINGIFFLDPLHGWAVGEKGTIVFSSDKGVTWTKQTSGTTLELEDVYFRNMNEGWAVGQNGLILATTDGGTTWAIQGEGVTGKTLGGIAPKHGSILWAAGFEGTLLKYVDDSYVTTSQIKMNEIFYNAFRNTELECQYIELYNAGSDVEYLDGKIICRLSRGDIDYVTYIWQFPGTGTDYPIQPGEYKILTPDAKPYTDLDLSNADFEFFVEGEFRPYDNPDVPNLINLINLADPTKKAEFLINYRSDVVVLASGKDIYWLDGLDIETIIDGVEYDTHETSPKSLNSLVDAGHAIGPTANYLGRSIERKEPGLDTNNSTNDFRMLPAPTPRTTAPSYKITGAVNYYSNDKSIADASMNLSGFTNFKTQSGADGSFAFDYLVGADFNLAVQKIGDIGDAVNPFDASLILQFCVGQTELTPAQKIAADVTKNGEVTAFDASFILRKFVGAVTEFPVKKDWAFIPKNFNLDDANWSSAPGAIEFKPLANDELDQNFAALVYGDVSGNWGETNLMKPQAIANISFGKTAPASDRSINLPLSIEQTEGLISGGFELRIDESQCKIVSIRSGEILDGSLFASHLENGVVRFAFASSFAINGAGVFATIEIEKAKDNFDPNESIQFNHVSLNEGRIHVTLNGQPLFDSANLPNQYALKQNYPNPFNPMTSIAFDLPKQTKVTIKVYDVLGREVASLVEKIMPAGSHTIQYDAKNLASGVYFYQIKTADFTSMKKMVLLK